MTEKRELNLSKYTFMFKACNFSLNCPGNKPLRLFATRGSLSLYRQVIIGRRRRMERRVSQMLFYAAAARHFFQLSGERQRFVAPVEQRVGQMRPFDHLLLARIAIANVKETHDDDHHNIPKMPAKPSTRQDVATENGAQG